MKKLLSILMMMAFLFGSFGVLVYAADDSSKSPSTMSKGELDNYISPMDEEELDRYLNSLSDQEIGDFLFKRYGFDAMDYESMELTKEQGRELDISLIKLQEQGIKWEEAQKAERAKNAQAAQASQGSQGAGAFPSSYQPTGDPSIDANVAAAMREWFNPTNVSKNRELWLGDLPSYENYMRELQKNVWQGPEIGGATSGIDQMEATLSLFDAVALGYVSYENLPAESKRFYDYGKRELVHRSSFAGESSYKFIAYPCVTFSKKENEGWKIAGYDNPKQLNAEDAIGLGYLKREEMSEHDQRLIELGALHSYSIETNQLYIDTEITNATIVAGLGLRTFQEMADLEALATEKGWEISYFDMKDMLFHIQRNTGELQGTYAKWKGAYIWESATEDILY